MENLTQFGHSREMETSAYPSFSSSTTFAQSFTRLKWENIPQESAPIKEEPFHVKEEVIHVWHPTSRINEVYNRNSAGSESRPSMDGVEIAPASSLLPATLPHSENDGHINTSCRSEPNLERNEHKDEESVDNMKPSNIPEERHFCSYCQITFDDQKSLDRHLENHGEPDKGPFRCPHCSTQFLKSTDFTHHLTAHVCLHICPECGQVFLNKTSLTSHISCHTTYERFECEHCKHTFSHKTDLSFHMRTHLRKISKTCVDNGSVLKCLRCNTLFENRLLLKIHEKDHPCKCRTCCKVFFDRSTLRRHLKIHKGQKCHECVKCRGLFSREDNLRKHMRVCKNDTPMDDGDTHDGDFEFGGHFLNQAPKQADDIEHSGSSSKIVKPNTEKKPSPKPTSSLTNDQQASSKVVKQDPKMNPGTIKSPLKLSNNVQASSKIMKPDPKKNPSTIKPPSGPLNNEQALDLRRLNDPKSTSEHEKSDELQYGGHFLHDISNSSDIEVQEERESSEESSTEALLLDEEVECTKCAYTCTSMLELRDHYKVHNIDEAEFIELFVGKTMPFQCKHCDKNFSRQKYLTKHMKTHMPRAPFECEECGQKYYQKYFLERHMEIHNSERPNRCFQCGKCFLRKYHLNRHLKTHSDGTDGNFECRECHDNFVDHAMLVRHMASHNQEKPHVCKKCGNRYSQAKGLKKHMKIHKPRYECGICGRLFTAKKCLPNHIKSHDAPSAEKTHKCPICGKELSKNSSLSEHMRSHNGEKPHKCNDCGERFSRKYHLTRHARIHSGHKPYECSRCESKFSRAEYLMKHEKSHMNKELKKIL